MKFFYTSIFLFFLSLSINVSSFNISKLQNLTTPVYDETKTLSEQNIKDIENTIDSLRKKYSVEILTVLIESTDGQDIGQLAVEIGHQVGVGKKDVDNGIVILIALQDRTWFIATGYGVEGALPDIIVNRIGENIFPDYFRNGDYTGGIIASINDMESYLSGDTGVISKLSETGDKNDINVEALFRYFIIIVIISSVVFYEDLEKGRNKEFFKKLFLAYLITLPIAYIMIGIFAFVLNFFIWLIASLVGSSKGNGGGSSGGYKGGGSSHSSGGFGGFGGGGFGGGGAGGRW